MMKRITSFWTEEKIPKRIAKFFAPPVFEEDEDKTNAASLLNVVLWSALGLALLTGIVLVLIRTAAIDRLPFVAVISLAILGILFWFRRGEVRRPSILLVEALGLGFAFIVGTSGGVRISIYGFYGILIILSGLLLGGRAAFITAGVSTLIGLVLVFMERQGQLPPASITLEMALVTSMILFFLTATFVLVPVSRLRAALRRARQSNRELQAIRQSLEQREQERATELAQASESLRQQNAYLTALHDTTLDLMEHLDVNELLQTVVARAGALVGTEHGYVFLLDRETGEMKMRVGLGTYANLVGTQAKLGRGLAGMIWQTGAPLSVDDYQNWPRKLSGPERAQLQSVAGVPLRARTARPPQGLPSGAEPFARVVGVIGLAYLEPGRKFGPSEIEVLNRFGHLVSIALENARLYAQQAALAQENQKFVEQARQTSEENRQLFERAQQAVEELNGLTRRLTGEAWKGYLGQKAELFVQAARPEGGATSQNLPALDQALTKKEFVKIQHGAGCSVGVPIVIRGQVIGSLAVEDEGTARDWSEDEIQIMKDIAEHVSLALDNARLFEQSQMTLAETRRRAEREAELAAINDRLHRSAHVKDILKIAAEELRRKTGSSRTVVWMPRTEDNGADAIPVVGEVR